LLLTWPDMDGITLRIVDGADRGRIYTEIQPPITIGREEGNTIQLNDERVSRFHLKIQRDHEDLVLTDLASTNGTKVNGEETHLRILRHGDMISLGRSLLVFGSRSEINQRLKRLCQSPRLTEQDKPGQASDWDQLVNQTNAQLRLLELDPPGLPSRLTPGQAAQLSELLEFIHLQLRRLISSVNIQSRGKQVELNLQQWHQLVDLQARLAEYLRLIAIPEE
jgi:pSer/pThr/pTyr-binding forkhead associated (FHA) protein